MRTGRYEENRKRGRDGIGTIPDSRKMTALDKTGRVLFLLPEKVAPCNRCMYTPIHQVMLLSYSRMRLLLDLCTQQESQVATAHRYKTSSAVARCAQSRALATSAASKCERYHVKRMNLRFVGENRLYLLPFLVSFTSCRSHGTLFMQVFSRAITRFTLTAAPHIRSLETKGCRSLG